jgi:hypothetical protein
MQARRITRGQVGDEPPEEAFYIGHASLEGTGSLAG